MEGAVVSAPNEADEVLDDPSYFQDTILVDDAYVSFRFFFTCQVGAFLLTYYHPCVSTTTHTTLCRYFVTLIIKCIL